MIGPRLHDSSVLTNDSKANDDTVEEAVLDEMMLLTPGKRLGFCFESVVGRTRSALNLGAFLI